MSKSEIVFDDPSAKCTSYLQKNQKNMEVCVSSGCLTIPNYVCTDCAHSIHHQHNEILSSDVFVRETNRRAKALQEKSFKLEGHLSIFSENIFRMKKMYSGEIERFKNMMHQHLDTLKEILTIFADTLEKKVKSYVSNQTSSVTKKVNFVKPQRISQLSQDQLSFLISTYWHSDLEARLDANSNAISGFVAPFQGQLHGQMTNLMSQLNEAFNKSKTELETNCAFATEELMRLLLGGDVAPKESNNGEQQTLLRERDQLIKEMQNLATQMKKTITQTKYYYGYYYLKSNYAQYPELPINRQGKCRKLNDKMHAIVYRLHEIGHRDNSERDFIIAHFIQ